MKQSSAPISGPTEFLGYSLDKAEGRLHDSTCYSGLNPPSLRDIRSTLNWDPLLSFASLAASHGARASNFASIATVSQAEEPSCYRLDSAFPSNDCLDTLPYSAGIRSLITTLSL
jgi:hypothetical protein